MFDAPQRLNADTNVVSDKAATSYRVLRRFVKWVAVICAVCTLWAGGCVANHKLQLRLAWRDYAALEKELSGVLRVGVPKAEVLRALTARKIKYTNYEQSVWLADGVEAQVVVMVRKYQGIPFSEELYLGVDFQGGTVSVWRPFFEGGP